MKTLTELSLQLQLREFSLFSFFQQTTKCRVVVFCFGGVSKSANTSSNSHIVFGFPQRFTQKSVTSRECMCRDRRVLAKGEKFIYNASKSKDGATTPQQNL